MKTSFLNAIFIFFSLLYSVQAKELKTGDSIQDVSATMLKAGYKSIQLEMEPNRGFDLRMWSVDSGVLIFTYSSSSQKVTAISYFLTDDRPKSLRTEFNFPVLSFDSVSGNLAIKTQKNRTMPSSESSETLDR